jgi:hypothetical protein
LMATYPGSNAQKPPVFRTPREISDIVYEASNTLAHKAKLTPGTAVYANRMIREEAFTREELIELRDIMALDAPETEVSKEVLGGRDMLRWVEGIFESRLVGRDRDRNVISPN